MKRQISFFCAVVAGVVCLTATTFGQVLKVEPEKPKWGDKLKITYDPSAPGAVFTGGESLDVEVLKFLDGDFSIWKRVPMMKADKLLTAEVTVESDFEAVTVRLARREKVDQKSRRLLMVYRADGQPVKGAYLSQAIGNKEYEEWIDKELALYPDNYCAAYRVKWQAARSVGRPNLKSIIEADIKQVSAQVKGESLAWLSVLNVGYLSIGQEEKSREVLRTMVGKYPVASETGRALNSYEYESEVQRFIGAGPHEARQIMLGYMRRDLTSASARRLAVRLASDKALPLDVPEMVLRRWINDEPQAIRPYLALAEALSEREKDPEQIAVLSDKTLELLLMGKAQESGLSNAVVERMLPRICYLSAKAFFKMGRSAQALSAIKAAQALNKETPADYLLLEGRIWEKAGMLTKAEQVYLTAWQRGSKEAAAALKALYLQDGGAPDGFENWLSKRSAETGAVTASTTAKKSFADFSVTTIAGKKYELAALRGKVVVLNFWFISCGPCRAEMPELNKLVKEYESRGVVFLAATFDDAESVKAFQKEKAFNYEIIPDARAWIDELGVKAFPTHYILNPQGEVELMLLGGSDKNLEQIRNVLARLTAGK